MTLRFSKYQIDAIKAEAFARKPANSDEKAVDYLAELVLEERERHQIEIRDANAAIRNLQRELEER